MSGIYTTKKDCGSKCCNDTIGSTIEFFCEVNIALKNPVIAIFLVKEQRGMLLKRRPQLNARSTNWKLRLYDFVFSNLFGLKKNGSIAIPKHHEKNIPNRSYIPHSID
ncbi:hypothetical protein Bhyg_07411 [Pseudolycoriella hygida]|uniref:Uncharacterized protein n=1 Tax=Pseudolycoriella hygida TaxID=35572 RepID=A0A9Q0N3J3_9DIPT|nr:hypothetical protein Bhyg_07411 [Pseudolycoriella hygida]